MIKLIEYVMYKKSKDAIFFSKYFKKVLTPTLRDNVFFHIGAR